LITNFVVNAVRGIRRYRYAFEMAPSSLTAYRMPST